MAVLRARDELADEPRAVDEVTTPSVRSWGAEDLGRFVLSVRKRMYERRRTELLARGLLVLEMSDAFGQKLVMQP